MRIDAFNKIAQTYGVNGKLKTNAVAKVSQSDKVEISSFGKEMQIARQAVRESADIREDKVSDLKAKIDSGEYNVSADSFAEKLLARYEVLRG